MKRLIHFISIIIFAVFFIAQAAQAQNYEYDSETVYKLPAHSEPAVIYPNPVTDSRFYVKSEKIISSVEVINMIGQTISKINNETGLPYNILVSMPECDKGLYMIRIIYEDKNAEIQKIMLN